MKLLLDMLQAKPYSVETARRFMKFYKHIPELPGWVKPGGAKSYRLSMYANQPHIQSIFKLGFRHGLI